MENFFCFKIGAWFNESLNFFNDDTFLLLKMVSWSLYEGSESSINCPTTIHIFSHYPRPSVSAPI